MRFSIYINQAKALEWGLNVQQAVLMAFCNEIASWAQPVTIENETYFFASKNKIANELPLVSDKVDTIYRLLKVLDEKGLIKYKSGTKDYIQLTEKGSEWNSVKNPTFKKKSDKLPKELGKSSEKGSEILPIDNITIENKKTIDNNEGEPNVPLDPSQKLAEEKRIFLNTLYKFLSGKGITEDGKFYYPKNMVVEFAKYWLAVDTFSKKKVLAFKKETTFDLGGRLARWFSNLKGNPVRLSEFWDVDKNIDLIEELKKLL